MAGRIFFDAILRPNRPLSPRGLLLVIGFAGVVSLAAGILFILCGAWPVTPFLGADVLLLALAMRASARASRRHEHLVLTSETLLIERVSAEGELKREEIDPNWLRVDQGGSEPIGAGLALVSRRKRWIVGAFLGADERASLAEALQRALREARTSTVLS